MNSVDIQNLNRFACTRARRAETAIACRVKRRPYLIYPHANSGQPLRPLEAYIHDLGKFVLIG